MTMAKDALEAHFAESRCEIAGQQFTSVASPLTRAISRNLNIVDLLEENPAEGDQILAALVSETQSELDLVTGEFNYIVAGAEPEFTTPMQYGGHFLELDRDLIGSHKPAITLIGGPETYVDIVSDLAETFLVWNPATNPVSPEEVAKMTRARTVTIVSNFPHLIAGGSQ